MKQYDYVHTDRVIRRIGARLLIGRMIKIFEIYARTSRVDGGGLNFSKELTNAEKVEKWRSSSRQRFSRDKNNKKFETYIRDTCPKTIYDVRNKN